MSLAIFVTTTVELGARAAPHRSTPGAEGRASSRARRHLREISIKEVLGHRHLSSTQVYTHATKEDLYNSSQALE